MELKFLTPTEVWSTFNPVKESLETALVSSIETGNIVQNRLFFTAESTDKGRVRAFANIYYDNRWADNRACMLMLSPMASELDMTPLIHSLLDDGYVVCTLDYCGNNSDESIQTSFPEDLEYCKYSNCVSSLLHIKTSAIDTCWYHWTVIVRRAISMLSEHRLVDESRIGIIGFGTGAQISLLTAGIDGRVHSVVPVNGGGYLWSNKKAHFLSDTFDIVDEIRAFSSGVGAETYARFISCPTCLIACSNSNYFDVDRVGDVFNSIPSENKRLIISHGTKSQITKTAFDSMLMWLRSSFLSISTLSNKCSLTFEQSGGCLYLKLVTETEPKNISLYISYGEAVSFNRYWQTLSNAQKTGEAEYTFSVPITNVNELIVAYASVLFDEETFISTPVVGILPNTLGITHFQPADIASTKIVYNGNMGISHFFATTNEVLLHDDVLKISKGPLKIKGITTKKGSLCFARSINDLSTLDSSSFLQFDLYSPLKRDLTIEIHTYPDLKKFNSKISIEGGEFWQKTMLCPSDFKSVEGRTLPSFTNAKLFLFMESEGIIFNNILWI